MKEKELIINVLEHRKITRGVIIDFTITFDHANQNILVYKLYR